VAGAGGAAVATNIGGGAWAGNSLAYSSAYVGVRYLDYTIKSKGGKGVQDMVQYLHDNAGKTLDDAFANASHGAFASNAAFLANVAGGGAQSFMVNVMNDAMLANTDTGSIGGSDVTGDSSNLKTAASVANDFGNRSGTEVLAGFAETWESLSTAGGTGNIQSFQVGANAKQTIDTAIGAMNLGALGLSTVDVTTVDNASLAMRHIDKALDYVNGTRAKLGAQMSRFESAVSNLQVSSENMTASRSRVMDADFARETAALSRAQILQQAGTAMVAQANQMPRMVLGLLR
jgi:flagellin